jgi:hypothetical protein
MWHSGASGADQLIADRVGEINAQRELKHTRVRLEIEGFDAQPRRRHCRASSKLSTTCVIVVNGDTWESNRTVPDEFRDLGGRVLMLGRMEGRGKGSGAPVDAPFGVVFDFRGDKVSHARSYVDQGEASRAAGLSEDSR